MSAIYLFDESRCQEVADAANNTCCKFHARQAYGLYKGYKRRGKALEVLEGASCPAFISNSKTNIRNETFAAMDDETTLDELHKYLFCKYALLDRIIRARRLHHARFYPINLDYGHKAYIDKLVNDCTVTLQALGRLERRTAEFLHAQQRWFKWVRERQDEEDAAKDKESEMVKKEARLFARHSKEVQSLLARKKREEDVKRQEAFLDEAYQERLGQMSEDEADEGWVPIEDAVEDERDSFVELMKRLLWLGNMDGQTETDEVSTVSMPVRTTKSSPKGKENVDPSKAMNKNARKRAKAKAKALEGPNQEAVDEGTVKIEVNESKAEMRKRLVDGVRYRPSEGVKGEIIGGTVENHIKTIGRIPPFPAEEVDTILEEVEEIKLYLFSRLLLSQATLLPAALRANSVEAFLADPEIAISELRDLCLKFEQPFLQEIRDACADYFRSDSEEADEEPVDKESTGVTEDSKSRKQLGRRHLPAKWRSKQEEKVDMTQKALESLREDASTLVDFGAIEDGTFSKKLVRVAVCGKTILNYPSNSAMPRAGWLHFSIIARGCRLFDAIELCRNWDEFWELNVLAIFKFFPAAGWDQWCGDRLRQQLLQLGVIRYLQFDQAKEMTVHHKAEGGGQGRAIHATWQLRNVLAVHIAGTTPSLAAGCSIWPCNKRTLSSWSVMLRLETY